MFWFVVGVLFGIFGIVFTKYVTIPVLKKLNIFPKD